MVILGRSGKRAFLCSFLIYKLNHYTILTLICPVAEEFSNLNSIKNPKTTTFYEIIKVSKKAKIKNLYYQVLHLNQDTKGPYGSEAHI